jgi:hypothetical protein
MPVYLNPEVIPAIINNTNTEYSNVEEAIPALL